MKNFLQQALYSRVADFVVGIRQAEECSRWADETKETLGLGLRVTG